MKSFLALVGGIGKVAYAADEITWNKTVNLMHNTATWNARKGCKKKQIIKDIPKTTFINGNVIPAPIEAKMPAAYAK